ncbi:MAG: hypothetical protein ACRC5T_05235 [Cetobacterium sp.]
MNKYFYVGKKEATKHQSMVYAVSDTKIEDYINKINSDAIEFYGEDLPFYLTVVNGDEVREATDIELYKSGIYKLYESEFIKDDTIMNINDFEIPDNIVKPVFNYGDTVWEESATEEEIDEYIFNEHVKFYNSELEFATKVNTEFTYGIIESVVYEQVKEYIIDIDPYRPATFKSIQRPAVFDRYV